MEVDSLSSKVTKLERKLAKAVQAGSSDESARLTAKLETAKRKLAKEAAHRVSASAPAPAPAPAHAPASGAPVDRKAQRAPPSAPTELAPQLARSAARLLWRGADDKAEGFAPPLLMSFPQGLPKNPASMRVHVQRPQNESAAAVNARRRVVANVAGGEAPAAASSDAAPEFALEGQNFGKGWTARAQWLVGVRDKRTGALELFPAQAQHIFVLRPNHLVAAAAGTARAATDVALREKRARDERDMTGAERQRRLFDEFGSREKKKRLDAQEAARIDAKSTLGSQTLSQEIRKANAVSAAAPTHDSGAAESASATPPLEGIVPVHNATTADPAAIYVAEEIIGLEPSNRRNQAESSNEKPELRDALASQARRLATEAKGRGVGGGSWLPSKLLPGTGSSVAWPRFVTDRLQGSGVLQQNPFDDGKHQNSATLQTRACALIALRHMMKLYTESSPFHFGRLIDRPDAMLPQVRVRCLIRSLHALTSWLRRDTRKTKRQVVLVRLLAKFSVGGASSSVYVCTKPLRQKLLAHILALCLALNGGEELFCLPLVVTMNLNDEICLHRQTSHVGRRGRSHDQPEGLCRNAARNRLQDQGDHGRCRRGEGVPSRAVSTGHIPQAPLGPQVVGAKTSRHIHERATPQIDVRLL